MKRISCNVALFTFIKIVLSNFRYTTLVDRYVSNIAACLKDPSTLVRKQTLTLVTRLIQVQVEIQNRDDPGLFSLWSCLLWPYSSIRSLIHRLSVISYHCCYRHLTTRKLIFIPFRILISFTEIFIVLLAIFIVLLAIFIHLQNKIGYVIPTICLLRNQDALAAKWIWSQAINCYCFV